MATTGWTRRLTRELLRADPRQIDLSGRELDTLPQSEVDVLAANATVEILLLANNRLHLAPESLGTLTTLTTLDLSNNDMLSLPACIQILPHLSTLNASRNSIELVPELEYMTALTELDLDDNSLIFMDVYFAAHAVTRLRSIDMSHNNTTEAPASLNAMGWFNQLGALVDTVRFNDNDLHEFPMPPAATTRLRVLHIAGGSLVDIPARAVSFLTRLAELNIGAHAFLNVPQTLGYCSRLLRLDLSRSAQLLEVDSTIGYLRSLVSLVLSDCPSLQRIDDAVSSLESLQRLDIRNCPALQTLPWSFHHLPSLRRLGIDNRSWQPAFWRNLIVQGTQEHLRREHGPYAAALPDPPLPSSVFFDGQNVVQRVLDVWRGVAERVQVLEALALMRLDANVMETRLMELTRSTSTNIADTIVRLADVNSSVAVVDLQGNGAIFSHYSGVIRRILIRYAPVPADKARLLEFRGAPNLTLWADDRWASVTGGRLQQALHGIVNVDALFQSLQEEHLPSGRFEDWLVSVLDLYKLCVRLELEASGYSSQQRQQRVLLREVVARLLVYVFVQRHDVVHMDRRPLWQSEQAYGVMNRHLADLPKFWERDRAHDSLYSLVQLMNWWTSG